MSDDIVGLLLDRAFRLATRDFNGDGARLAKEAADEILRLRAEIEKMLRRIHLFKNTRNEQVFEKLLKAHEEIEKLRAALKPFVVDGWVEYATFTGHYLREAAAAYKETGHE